MNGAKPRTLPRGVSPIGADLSGGNSPYTTIQRVGRSDAVVPERITIDEGVVDSTISLQGSKIEYSGGGLKTDVGKRVAGTTRGMSVSDVPAKGHAYATDDFEPHSVSRPRTALTTEEPVRGTRELKVKGKSRVEITKRTKEMLEKPDDFNYEALDELGPIGSFGDEDLGWLRRGARKKKKKEKKPVNRVKSKRTKPVRGRDDNMTTLGGVRP